MRRHFRPIIFALALALGAYTASSAQMRIDGSLGRGTVTVGTLKVADGSSSTPSVTFANLTTAGLFKSGSNLGMVSASSIVATIGSGAVFRVSDGASGQIDIKATDNSILFGSGQDLVINRLSADTLGFAAGDGWGLASKAVINTAPSGPVACTSPTVTNSNGTLAFQIDVGGTCTGVTTLVVTMPAATNAWAGCTATHVNSPTTRLPRMTASTTTSITFTNFDATTGLAADWADGNDIRVGGCVGG